MSHGRKKKCQHRFQKKAGWKDSHHLKPRSRGGQSIESNLLSIDAYKHDAWHLLFSNLTLEEVIELLQRLASIKKKSRKRIFL